MDILGKYQRTLNNLMFDEFSAVDFLTGIDNGQMHSRRRAQAAVDFIYRCYTAKLIYPSRLDDPWHHKTPLEVAQIYAAFPDEDIDNGGAWYSNQWCTTDETKKVMESFGIDDWQCSRNEAFIAWMLKQFEDAGVPLNDKPLIPLKF